MIFLLLILAATKILASNETIFYKDIQLKIVATTEKDEEALANNVRIKRISVNGIDIDMSGIGLNTNSNWAYDSEHDFLYIYNSEKVDTVCLNLKDVKTLDITYIKEIGSGIVDILVDDETKDSVNLFTESSWEEEKKTYEISGEFEKRITILLIGIVSYIASFLMASMICKRIAAVLKKKTKRQLVILGKKLLISGVLLLICILIIDKTKSYYESFFAKDISLEIVATAKKDEKALANNVRIKNICVNNAEVDLNNLEISTDVNWKYDSDKKNVYIYNAKKPETINIDLEDVYKLEITFIEEVGAGIAEVVVNDKIIDVVNLYADDKWNENTIVYDLTILDNQIFVLGISIVIYVIIYIFVSFIYDKRRCIRDTTSQIMEWLTPLTGRILVILAILMLFFIVNSIFKQYYEPLFAQDITLEIKVTSEKNEKAVANNVRVKKITVNNVDLDLSGIELKRDSNWKYNHENDFLYIYNSIGPEGIQIELENVEKLEITYIREIGSGYVEVLIDNKLRDSVDLYIDSTWEEKEIEYNVVGINRLSVRVLVGTLGLLCSWLITQMIYYVSGQSLKYEKRAKEMIVHLGLSILITIFINFIQYKTISGVWNYVDIRQELFSKTIVFFFLLIELLFFVSKKTWIAFGVTAFIGCFMNIASRVKIENRGNPLVPWDISLVSEALSVVDNYKIALSVAENGIIILVLAISWFLYSRKQKSSIGKNAFVSVCGSISLALITVVYVYAGFMQVQPEEDDIQQRVYQLRPYYEERGFVPAFLELLVYINPAKEPENYSKLKMQEIYEQVSCKEEETTQEATPNIIAIMSESFWDMSRLDTITMKEEVLPHFNALKEEARYGNLFAHVVTGGTVSSEFEFLTGFNTEFFPKDYMVYGSFLEDNFFSVVSLLEEKNYDTVAIHPYIATNYNRLNAYNKLGFNESLFEEEFESAEKVRNYISDQALYEKIFEIYERKDDEPIFVFAITMQNHGGYWATTLYEDQQVDFETSSYGEQTRGSISDYLAGLHESDRALSELIDYFREQEEETIIIYFGDHMSDAGENDDRLFEKTEWNSDNMNYEYETHIVPFLVWSNFESVSKNLGIMQIGQLLPTVFEEYGIRSNEYWRYLTKQKDYYLATGLGIVINPDSSYNAIEYMNEEQRKYYEYHKLIQYDFIYGEKYLEGMWK